MPVGSVLVGEVELVGGIGKDYALARLRHTAERVKQKGEGQLPPLVVLTN